MVKTLRSGHSSVLFDSLSFVLSYIWLFFGLVSPEFASFRTKLLFPHESNYKLCYFCTTFVVFLLLFLIFVGPRPLFWTSCVLHHGVQIQRCTVCKRVYGMAIFVVTARLAKRAKVMFSLCVSVHRGGGPIPQCIGSVGPPPPQQSFGQKVLDKRVLDKKVLDKKVLDKKLDKHFGNFWRWGARAVRLLRSRRRTVLLQDKEDKMWSFVQNSEPSPQVVENKKTNIGVYFLGRMATVVLLLIVITPIINNILIYLIWNTRSIWSLKIANSGQIELKLRLRTLTVTDTHLFIVSRLNSVRNVINTIMLCQIHPNMLLFKVGCFESCGLVNGYKCYRWSGE